MERHRALEKNKVMRYVLIQKNLYCIANEYKAVSSILSFAHEDERLNLRLLCAEYFWKKT